jgi:putative nucleotidyltransferase with HDIG domain
VLPPIYLLYRSYRLYLGKLEGEKKHAERLSNLHLQTIEALALAIEAKDRTTGEHLQRVRVYAMELAKELGLTEDETEALRAASVLHDIGKLAVPEHIISKPGKLTPEEFETMKIHPIVGAEILEQVDFPYPVVPIVRAHHEKWDGSGYPYGLAGDAIPIGARILSAVDCLDAMATDRQYRKALPISQAMDLLVKESGTSYDPKIVSILARRYVELEKMAKAEPLQAPPKLSTDIKVERGLAPGVGFAEAAAPAVSVTGTASDPVSQISDARKRGEEILGLTKQIGASVNVEDALSLLASRLKRLISHDSMAVFFPSSGILLPEFVSGDNFRLISSLRIPLGKGLVGWVAQNRKSILNGNPTVEPGYAVDPAKHTLLGSALAVPVGGPSGTPAVLVLYRVGQHAFTDAELAVAESFSAGLGEGLQGPAQNAPPKAAGASAK